MTFNDYILICEISAGVCMAALFVLLWLLRRNGPSLALPFAYLSLLVLNHVPGVLAPIMDEEFYVHLPEVTEGIKLTAIGIVCFVVGVWYARYHTKEQRLAPQVPSPVAVFREDRPFWMFCLVGGWVFVFCLMTPLRNLPSIGAVIGNGGAVWMLGILLGLRWSVRNKKRLWTTFWMICLLVYPVMILLLVGFLSYGTTASLIVLCVLAVSARGYWRVVVSMGLIGYLGLSLFSNYFQARDRIRDVVWSGATIERRVEAVSEIFTDWKFFDSTDKLVLAGLDLRLNQNYFVGLAAQNLDNGSVNYLHGSSVTDALLALVPRVLWPGKTVFGGSPEIVGKMTGLTLSSWTSFGVGNVMEFYINFGMPGLILGFLVLGWALGRLDHRAALAETRGDYATVMLFFLPGTALIQPIGSMVELVGSASSAWIAAYFWKWAWDRWRERKQALPMPEAVAH
ncbi:MAG: hypothetical protein RL274_467 [Pseudomonadota bacterium]